MLLTHKVDRLSVLITVGVKTQIIETYRRRQYRMINHYTDDENDILPFVYNALHRMYTYSDLAGAKFHLMHNTVAILLTTV